jgi:hypothetical protein
MITKEVNLKKVAVQPKVWDDRIGPLQTKAVIIQAADDQMMIPAPVLVQMQQAHEILPTARGPLDAELWSALVTLPRRPGAGVTVLLDHIFDVSYTLRMLEAGFSVYEATVPDDDLIFLDRYHGYRLPNWEALPRQFSFSLACHLAWSRTGGYSCVHGTVAELTKSGLMKIAERSHLWFNILQVAQRPVVGERVTLLTYCPFLDAGSRLRDVVAILVDKENP